MDNPTQTPGQVPPTTTKPRPEPVDFNPPDQNQIQKLKEKYEFEGSKLAMVELSSGKHFIIRVVNRQTYSVFQQKQLAAGTVDDPYYIVADFFCVNPTITKQIYDSLLPGEVEMLIETLMKKHGYTQPIVYEL